MASPGTYISAVGHAGLVAWLILGWGLSSDPLPFVVAPYEGEVFPLGSDIPITVDGLDDSISLVSVYAGSTRTGSGIAVTECEQGETLLIQTNDHSCHDVMGDHSERWSTFSVVLIATT